MLNTIKFPSNIRMLKDKLPKSQYDSNLRESKDSKIGNTTSSTRQGVSQMGSAQEPPSKRSTYGKKGRPVPKTTPSQASLEARHIPENIPRPAENRRSKKSDHRNIKDKYQQRAIEIALKEQQDNESFNHRIKKLDIRMPEYNNSYERRGDSRIRNQSHQGNHQ